MDTDMARVRAGIVPCHARISMTTTGEAMGVATGIAMTVMTVVMAMAATTGEATAAITIE